VLVEQQAGEQAPLWLREGLVETLANSGGDDFMIVVPAKELDAALAHPADATVSRHAHQVAGRMAAMLVTRYGMAAVRDFLRNGVPPEVLKSLRSFEDIFAAPNGDAGSSSAARRQSRANSESPAPVAAHPSAGRCYR
jgi:hypothetical protein